jgi:hypothetical protein
VSRSNDELRSAQHSANLAILLFAAAIAYVIGDTLVEPRTDLDWIDDAVVHVVLAALWGASALALWRKWRVLSLVPYFGAFVMFVHGVISSVGSPGEGVPFLIAAPIAAVCVVRASRLIPSARHPGRPSTESA